MIKIKLCLSSFFLILYYLGCCQISGTTTDGTKVLLFEDGTWKYEELQDQKKYLDTIEGLELPKFSSNPNEVIIYREGYTVSYNIRYKQANWVAYELLNKETIRNYPRTNSFRPDEELIDVVSTNIDYKKSGWDRGHLAPAGDMGWSSVSMHESFYYSNISPQDPSFNRGIWYHLEDYVRRWTDEDKKLLVVTGPILEEGLETLGIHKISIPKYFYKIILDHTPPDYKALGFIFPNKGTELTLQDFVVTIDSIETLTGIDFFPKLPSIYENYLESSVNLSDWEWGFKFKDYSNKIKLKRCEYILPNKSHCNKVVEKSNERFCDHHLRILKDKTDNLILTSPRKVKN